MNATALTATQQSQTAPTGSSGAPASSSQAENPGGMLGQNDFLKLMVAQLQAQNPLEPGNSNEYINELAQFTDVEQITNLANANELESAVQMIGREVTYENAKGEIATGAVQSVQSDASGTTVTVEGEAGVKLASITNIE
ncbi:MAG TPA: flagellar hook capping FlgD N-terminal domain-containing protein [Solirubrobacteraceae bacterium]|nr:flagellar hook capping FlgD N-terminal domain-containing protein [Solirubrobacteraceae bacterium]